ncbi:ABC transporter permease [Erysipelotrichaceae bacterium OH741_COT-311]|nr:ABC transporter permease [Erysipelotrichaceae bacterium OH741_COT-311]
MEHILNMYNKRPNTKWIKLLVTAIIISLVIYSASGVTYKGIAAKGSDVAFGIMYGLTHPDVSIIFNFTKEGVPYLLAQTAAIAVLGTIFGAVLAIPFSFLCSKKIVGKYVAFVFQAIVLLIRTIPSVVWALVWIRVTGPGPFCGVVTQSICSIGMISKMFVTAIDDIDTGILESLDACGCTTFQKIRYGILPQLSSSFISTTIYRFDINLKDATVLGIVGAGGIGAVLQQSISSRRWTIVGAFLLSLIVAVLVIEYFSTRIRKKLARGQ